ncbi:transmembrane protein, putative (macronuclear) [Tetrahymena thermophila SB210]|uniref:Transmembrane protein, putative n=1 Tax=Tetrahymena thermophila (strain SB210) TaxID=312017 RepID=W7XCG6_TETTS|nr:transmembrane protein, putative [Tetrahymena thermophila SB210]EWS71456.1 transmembrane protein, putative [Tetrahymena thermophila SB210]|eukprot:XP_012656022.1 transmembrane protein, putative [Tetrahymena thermophila SB210]
MKQQIKQINQQQQKQSLIQQKNELNQERKKQKVQQKQTKQKLINKLIDKYNVLISCIINFIISYPYQIQLDCEMLRTMKLIYAYSYSLICPLFNGKLFIKIR